MRKIRPASLGAQKKKMTKNHSSIIDFIVKPYLYKAKFVNLLEQRK